MKLSFLRPSLLLALALGLSACGGKASFDVQGSVAGLQYAGLVLSNGEAEVAVSAGATTFKFPNSIEYGDVYDVKVKTAPAHQLCEVVNGADTAGRLTSINIGIFCALESHSLGGTVSGLTAAGLVLTNGSDGAITVAKDATKFLLPAVKYGSAYGVTVLTQPPGGLLTCSVTNGVGEMGDAAVENIAVTCVPTGS